MRGGGIDLPAQDNQSRRNLKKNVVAQYGLQFAKYVFPLVTIPYLTRVLGAEAFGVRAYVLACMTLAQTFVDFGFNLSATKDIVKARDDREAIGKIVADVLLAKVGIVFLVGLCIAGIALFIPILYENPVYLALSFCAVAINGFLPDYLFMGIEKMQVLTTRYVGSKTLALVLMVLLIHSDADLLLVPIIDIASSAVALVWSWKSATGLKVMFLMKPTISGAIEGFRSSTLYFATNFSASLFNTFATLAIGAFINNLVAVSYWSLSMSIINAVQSLYSPMSTALYPHMIARRDIGLLKSLLLYSLPILILGTAAILILAKPIMLIAGGDEYSEGAGLLRALCPILITSFYSIMLGWPVLGAYERIKEIAITTVFAGAFLIVATSIAGIAGLLTIYSAALLRNLSELILAGTRAWCVKESKITIIARPDQEAVLDDGAVNPDGKES